MMTTPPTITPEVKLRFPMMLEEIAELEGQCQEYEPLFVDRFVSEPDPNGDPALSLRDKTRLLLMAVTCHARALTWGLIRAINSDSPPAVFLLVRAHFEATGMMAYLLVRLRKHRSGELSEQMLHDAIVRLHLGTKKHPPGLPTAVVELTTAVSVASFADAVDKLPELKAGGRFRDTWEWLSEFCHPNTFSRVISGQHKEGREMHFDRVPTLKEHTLTTVLTASSITQEVFFLCRQEAVPLVEQLRGDV